MLNYLPSFFFESPERRRQREAAERKHVERRIANTTQAWSPGMKFEDELCVDAATYNAWVDSYRMFGEQPLPSNFKDPPGEVFAVSPTGKFIYSRRTLSRGGGLVTALGRRHGNVIFDAAVTVPILSEKNRYNAYDIWMSLTPLEAFTLRPGTRLAKGHTVIAGLGLGYQLINVSRKKSVKRITLVERDRELVNWILPEVRKHLGTAPVDVIVGDARSEVPKLEADVALIDIARGYGGNAFCIRCDGIKTIWVWGSSR